MSLEAPQYGFVKITGNVLDSVATYSCKKYYKLVGSATRKCHYNKDWTGSAPICVGK